MTIVLNTPPAIQFQVEEALTFQNPFFYEYNGKIFNLAFGKGILCGSYSFDTLLLAFSKNRLILPPSLFCAQFRRRSHDVFAKANREDRSKFR